MTTVKHFVNDFPNLNFNISIEIALANILQDVLVLLDVTDVHQCSKMDFPYLFVLCAFFTDLLSFLFHYRLFIWNQHCMG